MKKNNYKLILGYRPLILAAFILVLVMIGSVWYLLNAKFQIEEKEKIKIAENHINKLNGIYNSFLKAVRENRGYRLYGGEIRKKNYYTSRNNTLLLINEYKASLQTADDSSQVNSISNQIQERFKGLDKILILHALHPGYLPSEDELTHTDSLYEKLEKNHANLIAYWNKESESASTIFDTIIRENKLFFIIWIISTSFLGVFLVITLRKKTRAEKLQGLTEHSLSILQQKEEEFTAAFDYASIGMALVSTTGAWLRVNKSLCKLLGYSEQEFLQTKFQDITHPDDLDTDLQYVKQMLNKEIDTYQMEKRYFTKDGSLVWVLLSVSLVWEKGKPKYFISQIKNSTDRKLLQQQLESEKRRLELVIEGTTAGTWEWNVQTGQTIFNKHWANIIGYTLQELEPISIETWIKYAHPDDLKISNQKLQDCFDRKTEQYECACRMLHKSGEWIWVMDRGRVMTWTADGKPEWMFGSHFNITEMKNMEVKLELEREKFTTIFNSAIFLQVAKPIPVPAYSALL